MSPLLGCGPTSDTSAQATVRLVLHNYDPQSQTISADISLCVPPAMLEHIVGPVLGPRGSVTIERITAGNQYSMHVRKAFSEIPIGVRYQELGPVHTVSFSGNFLATVARETTFGRLVRGPSDPANPGASSPGGFVSLGSVVLPLTATPDRYPLDTYALRGELVVSFGHSALPVGYAPHGQLLVPPHLLPSRVQVFKGTDISPLVIRASALATIPALISPIVISLELVRTGTAKLFVAVILTIPMILALLLAIDLLGAPEKARGRIGPEALTGVTAVLLAILPIRIVLVPSALSTLTLVDYILGLEMAVLAAVACFGVIRNLSA